MVFLQQNGPSGIVNKIYFLTLVVSIAQATHAAQEIAEMHQCHQRAGVGAEFDGVMMRDDLYDIVAQVPFFGEGAPRVAVCEAHRGQFRLVQRDLFADGTFDGAGKFSRESQTVNHESDIVHQPGHVGFVAVRVRYLLAEFPADHCATERMPPKYRGIESPVLRREGLSQAASEENGLDSSQSQADDCCANGFWRLRQAEKRRTGYAQTLRRDRI